VRVVDVDPLWVDVPVPTADRATWELSVGAKAWALASVAGVPRIVEGKVIEVAPTADPASRTRRIRVEVPNPPSTSVAVPRLLAGEALWVRFTQPDAAQLPGLASADASKKVAATEGAK
jgi:multidrug efflux pump subunit AcrA (membrane-fusion protein)